MGCRFKSCEKGKVYTVEGLITEYMLESHRKLEHSNAKSHLYPPNQRVCVDLDVEMAWEISY